MANVSGLPDPTAETAVANVMKEGKASRFLPKQLHKVLRSLRDVLSLVGYDIVDIRMRDKADGKEYLWTEWK